MLADAPGTTPPECLVPRLVSADEERESFDQRDDLHGPRFHLASCQAGAQVRDQPLM
jgi:hypothetical protein